MCDYQIDDVLNYWFPNLSFQKWWFNKDINRDNEIYDKFTSLYINVINDKFNDWMNKPNGCMALIIVLDQFSRHIDRVDNKIDITKSTLLASKITKHFINKYENKIPIYQLPFLLMPLRHTLDMTDMNLLIDQINKYELYWSNDKYILTKFEADIWKRFKSATIKQYQKSK